MSLTTVFTEAEYDRSPAEAAAALRGQDVIVLFRGSAPSARPAATHLVGRLVGRSGAALVLLMGAHRARLAESRVIAVRPARR